MTIFNLFKPSSHIAPLAAAALCAGIAPPLLAQDIAALTRPETVVPPVNYRSVFKETSLGVEKDTSNWRKANEDVGKFTRGHVDILKSEELDSRKPVTAPKEQPMPKTAKPLVAPDQK